MFFVRVIVCDREAVDSAGMVVHSAEVVDGAGMLREGEGGLMGPREAPSMPGLRSGLRRSGVVRLAWYLVENAIKSPF